MASGYQPIKRLKCKRCDKICHGAEQYRLADGYDIAYNGDCTQYIVCISCKDKRRCVACWHVFDPVIPGEKEPRCPTCNDFAVKFWHSALPGDVVSGFEIEIAVEISTIKFCMPDGSPVQHQPRQQDCSWTWQNSACGCVKVERKTIRCPIQTSFDPEFFVERGMSPRFKETIGGFEEKPSDCKCQWPTYTQCNCPFYWLSSDPKKTCQNLGKTCQTQHKNECRRIYAVTQCRLVELFTPKILITKSLLKQ